MKIWDFFRNWMTWQWVFAYAGLCALGFIITGIQVDYYKVKIDQSFGWIFMIPFFLWFLIVIAVVICLLLLEGYWKIVGKKTPVEIQFDCIEKPTIALTIKNMHFEFNLHDSSKKHQIGYGLSFIKINLTNDIFNESYSLDKENRILILNISLNQIKENNSNDGEIFIYIGDQIISILPSILTNLNIENFDNKLFIDSYKNWFNILKEKLLLNNIYKTKYSEFN